MLTAPPRPAAAPTQAPAPAARWRTLLPGLCLVAAAVAMALVLGGWLEPLSPLVIATVIGAIAANLGVIPQAASPGIAFSGRTLLRTGVALLGFQVSVKEVLSLGVGELVMVMVVVGATFVATRKLGRRLGLGEDLSLLVATGYSICGASAIAAMDDVAHADEEDVAVAIALVTLCGSLAIAVLPMLRGGIGLDDPTMFGAWVGASVHDVGQVVATASSGGTDALHTAVLVKLTRVLMLAPMVFLMSHSLRRRHAAAAIASAASSGAVAGSGTVAVDSTPRARPKLVPTFLIGFVLAIAVRSTGLLSAGLLANIKHVQVALLAAGLFALGSGVRIAKLRKVGPTPFVLGIGSWIVIGVVSYVGVRLVHMG